jgi:protoporphyrinogen oxidase
LFEQRYGRALAQEVAMPLLEAWSGAKPEELAPAVADKLPASLGQTVFLRMASHVTRRAVAIGYCKTAPHSANVFHVYPDGGVGSICQKLARDLDGSIALESPVSKIYVEKGRARAIRLNGKDVPVRAVISTAPINKLADMVSGGSELERFRRFRFRGVVFVNLKLEGQHLLPDVLTWVPSGKPFFRLTEAPQAMPWLAPPKKTMILVEYGAEVGDRHWSMPDEALTKYTVQHLVPFVPDVNQRLLGARVQRSHIAYPVFLRDYEEDRLALTRGTGVENLLSIGRNGEFDHILMEDIYWRTLERIRTFVRKEAQAPAP